MYLPTVGWGVIDCCRHTQQYLAMQKVDRLAFVALTHPHRDHYAGFDAVVKPRVDRITHLWTTSAKSVRELRALQAALNQKGQGDLHGLGAVISAFRTAKERGALARSMSAVKPMLEAQHTLADGSSAAISIHAVSPSDDDEEAYVSQLARSLPKEGEEVRNLPDRDHNLIAAALIVQAGPWRVSLGSDVEAGNTDRMGWRGILSDPARPSLEVVLVKVSHHGSVHSHLDAVWDAHAGGAKKVPHSVVTPFASEDLPRSTDLDRLRGVSTCLHATALRATVAPGQVYPPRVVKKARSLKNWAVHDQRIGHVRYRASLATGSALRVERFGRARDATT
jgi:hypothetical protein